MTHEEHIQLCDDQAELCREATGNQSLGLMDRVGAQIGELDWMSEKALLQSDAESDDYSAFIRRKTQLGNRNGFAPLWLPSSLFDFQAYEVDWALRKGRCALLNDCGLGKSVMELVWSENIVRKTNKPVLLLTPLAVSPQMVREAEKFGIDAKRNQNGKVAHGAHTVVTNYERLKNFSPNDFAGVVCDESSCMKNFDGVNKQALTDFMRKVPYRLLASATASPNDYDELGTQSEAIGELGYMDMLNRFFKNDQNNSSVGRHFGDPLKWRLKGHAETPFFQWVCDWAMPCRRPSDLGFCDDGFALPPLVEMEHVVEASVLRDGCLFPTVATDLREQREERKRTLEDRCGKVASLVKGTGKQFLIWCQLNPEGDLIEKLVPNAVQISGRDKDEAKEEKWLAFANGQIDGIVSKQKIGGWGLNLQNCDHVVAFPDHSYEAYYQGIRRCWRFGQKNAVTVDLVITEGQRAVLANLQRKGRAADRMYSKMIELMGQSTRIQRAEFAGCDVPLPAWL